MVNLINNEMNEAENRIIDQSFKDYFADNSNKEFDEIAEYNFNKEEFEKKYGEPFIDFAKRNIDEDYGGQTIRGMAKVKDVAYSVAAGLIDVTQELGEIGFDIAYGATNYAMTGEWGSASDDEKRQTWVNPDKAYESKTGAGNIAYSIAKYAGASLPATGAMSMIKSPKAIANLAAKFSKTEAGANFLKKFVPVMQGMITDGLAFYKDKENLSKFIEENSDDEYVKMIAGWLSVDDDDSGAEVALKQALEGAVVGGLVNPIFKTLKYIKFGSKAKKYVDETVTKLDDVVNSTGKRLEAPEEEIMSEFVEAVKGGEIPRTKLPEAFAEKVSAVKDKLTQEGVDLTKITTDDVLKLASEDDKIFAKTVVAEENEKLVEQAAFDAFLDATHKRAAGEITDEEAKKILYESISSISKAKGATQDIVNSGASAMGYLSKSEAHKLGGDFIKYVSANIGGKEDKIFKAFENVVDAKDMAEKVNKLNKLAGIKGSIKDKFNNVIRNLVAIEQSMMMNKVSTFTKNLTYQLSYFGLDSLEKIPQAVVSNVRNMIREMRGLGHDYDVVKFKEVAYNAACLVDATHQGFRELLDFVMKKDTVTKKISKYRSDINNVSAYYGKQGEYNDGTFWGITKFLTKYSIRTAVDSTDNVMGYAAAQADFLAKADNATARAAAERGLTEEQAKAFKRKYIEEGTSKPIIDNIDIDSLKELDREAADAFAARRDYGASIEHSKEMTFKGGRGKISKYIADFFEVHPTARIISPFINVMSNMIIDRGIADRTFLGAASPRVRAIWAKGGRARDELIGKQLVGNMALATLMFNFADDSIITGGWSSDRNTRNRQKATGYQPYSLIYDSKETDANGNEYTLKKSYSLADNPLGVVIGIGADIRDAINSRKIRTDDPDLLEYIVFGSQAMTHYVFDNTSASVLADLYDFSKTNGDNYSLENIVKKFTDIATNFIPNTFSDYSGMLPDGRRFMQKRDELRDKLFAKIGKDTGPVLDCIGEPIPAATTWMGLVKKEKLMTPLAKALDELKAGFDAPKKHESFNGFVMELELEDEQKIIKEMDRLGVRKELYNMAVLPSKDFETIDNDPMLNEEGKLLQKRKKLSNIYNVYKANAVANLVLTDERFNELYTQAVDKKGKQNGFTEEVVEEQVKQVPTLTR